MRYDASTYGERIAEVYDELYSGGFFDDNATVEFYASVAGGGPALELGIGTGRIAVPLKATGVEVHGIDTSPKMVERMRAKPGGEDIPVSFGDFAEVPIEGKFKLVYIPFNTLFALLSQEDQVRCFKSVAEHLEPGGAFAFDAFVPDPTRFTRHQNVMVEGIEDEVVRLGFGVHDPVEQRVKSYHVHLSESGIKMYPVQIRYAYPAELDLMAQLAGLRLDHRYGGYRREPFDSSSQAHVSVYVKTGE